MSELPETERRDAASRGLDLLPPGELVAALARAQTRAAEAVLEAGAEISAAVEAIVARMERGGRLHYVGAGTSGRLAVLDAAEMSPTFGTPAGLVCAHIAGGNAALLRSVEGAEDDARTAEDEMRGHVAPDDAVVGISASGGARYVVAAMRAARAAGAYTIAMVNTESSLLAVATDATIVLRTGAEPIAGSTRMKAGTAQKIALNTISTAAMVCLGRVYDNLMVDVVATNEKLRGRATRLVALLAGCREEEAIALLQAASGSVKVAVVMARHNVAAPDALVRLERSRGRLRSALE
ncbi:MAG: N-acetylmuramic acid 6-phosphate etherase [Candidatus Baltobacteraceae bacterium]